MYKNVFVTGGTGFIGSYILEELIQRGYQVTAIRRSPKKPLSLSEASFEKINWIDCDLFDTIGLLEAMDGCDAVIHAAAMVSFHGNEREQLYKTNIEGTANIVNCALELNIQRLVYISSVAALGRTSSGEEVDEEKKWVDSKTNTHYAISKYKAEMEVWRGMGEGLSTVILNPSTVLGFGDWNQSSCAIFKNVYNEFPWYTNGVNGFVAVEDVALAAVLLLEDAVSSQRFIINGENYSFKKLFDSIAQSFQKKAPTKEATPFLGAIAWRLEAIKALFTGKKPLLTKETAKVAQSFTYFNNSKIRRHLKDFTPTPLSQSIDNACKKYSEAVRAGILAK
ncbi:MAG: NAD-dependent epimerase/dehydratase family protein [Chitinophagaceae bacterium]|nr:NAD-dependent epimerase/dehydratase family protein [Chitinophagaceae bacterium]